MQNVSLLLFTILPLLVCAALIPWLGKLGADVSWLLSLGALALALLMSSVLCFLVFRHGVLSYELGDWGLPWGIELTADYLSVILLLTVTVIGILTVAYSRDYIAKSLPRLEQQTFYYCLFCLLLGSMLAFLLAGDLFTMFVYLSVFSLSGVALVAVSGEPQSVWAAFRYLILSTASGVLILLGIAFLYYFSGTLNVAELSRKLGTFTSTDSVRTALTLMLVGFGIKAALFPLHLWMPDAHAFAPAPVSAILSGLVIEMGVYGMVRSFFFMFRLKGSLVISSFNTILCCLAAAAIIYGAVGAIFQEDLKLIFAYSSVSQIGYIVMGLGLASYFGLLGSMLHIINHAVMKSALFLAAGALFYRTGWRTLRELEGMGKRMPFTAGALALAGIAIIGIPPAGGFVSEWYICLGAIERQQAVFAVFILGGSLLSTVYYIKIINSLYFKVPEKINTAAAVREAPLSMLLPIWMLALASVGLGVFSRFPLLWLEKAVAGLL